MRLPDSISRRSALTGLSSLLLAPVAWAQAGGLLVHHAQGETRLPAVPQRVAVFDLAALDMLQTLGVAVAAVPKVQVLRALKPDLIIVASRSASKYAEMSAIAPTIDLSTSTQAFMASVVSNLLTLGRIFDRSALAAEKAETLLLAARALQTKSTKAGKGLLLFVAGQNISPQAAQTRFGVIYELVGITPAVAASDLPAPRPRATAEQAAPVAGSPEAATAEATRRREAELREQQLASVLAKAQPDWLFVLDRNTATGGAAQADKLLTANSAVQQTPAWSRRQVIPLDAPSWYLVGGGYQVVSDTIAQVDRAFGPLN